MAEADRLKWDQRYAQGGSVPPAPEWLAAIADSLPVIGSALDIAAGSGRLSLWLARRGLNVLAVDISSRGLELARKAAGAESLPIETMVADLESEPLPDGPFNVITCFHYRQRDLFPVIQQRLAPGGVFVGEIATVHNLERHAHPSRQYLAEPGELARDCHPLEIIYSEEGWFEGHALARVVARKQL